MTIVMLTREPICYFATEVVVREHYFVTQLKQRSGVKSGGGLSSEHFFKSFVSCILRTEMSVLVIISAVQSR